MTTLSKTKQFLLVLFMALCFSLCGLASSLNTFSRVFAAEVIGIENISITNQNFNSSSSSSLVQSPSGWAISETDDSVKYGVISTNATNFSSYNSSYGLGESDNPGKPTNSEDEKVLMINGKTSMANLGFKSNDITLSANSYYIFTVFMKTLTDDARGSIYVSGLDENFTEANSVISKPSINWNDYKIFIKTGNTSKTVKLELWLGSKTEKASSAVFFDNISLSKTSELYYLANYSVASETNRSFDITNPNIIKDFGFEDSSISFSPLTGATGTQINTNSNVEYPNLSSDNASAFFISNNEKTYSSYKSDELTIKKNLIYKISVDVKILGELEGDGGAIIKLEENTDTTNENCIKHYLSTYTGMSLETSAIKTNAANIQKNNYNTYSFYVKSNGLYSTEAHIVLMLGKSDATVKGSALFDDIKIETIDQKEYDNVSAGTYAYKTELTIQTSTPTINNGAFNFSNIDYVDFGNVNYPLNPNNWTSETNYDSDTKVHKFGIISTNDSDYNASAIGIVNPGNPSAYAPTSTAFNNVLLLANTSNIKQTVKSSSFSLSANSTYEVSLKVKTTLTGGNLNISLYDGTNAIKTFSDVSKEQWSQLKFIVKTNADSKSLTFNIELNNQGYVFIDDVRAITKTISDADYKTLVKEPPMDTKVLDYANGSWHLASNELNEHGVYDLLFFTKSLTENSFAGAIPGSSNLFGIESQNTDVYNNMLLIDNSSAGESTLTAQIGNSLSADKYYKIQLSVYTKNISGDNCGVSIKLSNIEQKFVDISSNGSFSTYSFYVSASEAATTNLSLSLKTTATCPSAIAYFDNYSVTEITETTFASMKSETETTPNAKVLIVGELAPESDDETEPEEDNSANNNQDDQRWLLIPSIVLAVSIIVALIGFSLRRIKIKRFRAKTETTYDRTKTLLKDIARREAEEKRAQEIARLEEELAQIQAEIDEYEQDYQNQLKEYRKARADLKIEKSKGRQQNIEKQFKDYASKRAKLDEKTNAIKDKIDSIKNPEYLDSEEKKIIAKQHKLKKAEEKEIKKQQKLIAKKENIDKQTKK